MDLKETFETIVKLVADHPGTEVLSADESGCQAYLLEDFDPEWRAEIFKSFEPCLGWVVFWMEGDLEHSHHYRIPLKNLKKAIKQLPSPLRAIVEVSFMSAQGRTFLSQILKREGELRRENGELPA